MVGPTFTTHAGGIALSQPKTKAAKPMVKKKKATPRKKGSAKKKRKSAASAHKRPRKKVGGAKKKPKKKVGGAKKLPKKQPKKKPIAAAPTADFSVGRRGTAKSGLVAQLGLNQLLVNKGFNPRTKSGPIDLLAASIKKEGVLSSLVVRPAKGKPNKFEIVAGERRYRALRSITFHGTVPCVIRTDIADDAHATAIALAENSEDGRNPLNTMDLAVAVKKLEKKGWPIAKIAAITGLHSAKVRRSLDLLKIPEELQKRVREGTLAMTTGLEIAKLDESERESVARDMSADRDGDSARKRTAASIRRIRQRAKQDEEAKKAAAKKGKTKRGKPAKRVITAWRSQKDKQETLQRLCWKLGKDFPLAKDRAFGEYFELRGMIAVILWDRGDLPTLDLPTPDSTDTQDKKILVNLMQVIEQEAARYTPTADEAAEAAPEPVHA